MGKNTTKTRGIFPHGVARSPASSITINIADMAADATTRLQAGDDLILFTSDNTEQELAGQVSYLQD